MSRIWFALCVDRLRAHYLSPWVVSDREDAQSTSA
jgi:hypothetical protein